MRSRAGALTLALSLLLLTALPAAADEVVEPETVVATPTPEPTTEPEPLPEASPEPTPIAPAERRTAVTTKDEPVDEAVGVEVDDAELRWGVNNESNNAAFAPGTANFFSAGKIPDPGKGGTTIPQSSWNASSGDVAIEKWNGSAYTTATWAGLRTDSAGVPITSPTSGRFSNHTVVIDRGTGTVDATGKSAHIRWDGDFTVLYYSGMSFFYVSDPELTVENGVGTVTATVSGFASSMEDLTTWEPVAPRTVTLADLGKVDLGSSKGFTVTPKYAGVAVTGVDQATGANFGSFPQSFVDFQKVAGAAAYWYSSGGATDKYKPALPLTVSYDAGDAVTPTPPPAGGGSDPVTNDVISPPGITAPNVRAPNVQPPTPALPGLTAPPAQSAFQQVATPVTLTAATSAADATSAAVWWWLGSAFLILAAASVAGTFAYSAASSRR